MTRVILVAAALLALALVCAGCTGEKPVAATPAPTTLTPSPTTPPTAAPTAGIDPVRTLPPAQDVDLDLSKDRVYSDITLIYNGGGGEMFTNKIEMRVTLPTGEVTDYVMNNGAKPKRGDTIVAKGSRGSDKCEVWVTSAGLRYKVIEENLVLGGFYGY